MARKTVQAVITVTIEEDGYQYWPSTLADDIRDEVFELIRASDAGPSVIMMLVEPK